MPIPGLTVGYMAHWATWAPFCSCWHIKDCWHCNPKSLMALLLEFAEHHIRAQSFIVMTVAGSQNGILPKGT